MNLLTRIIPRGGKLLVITQVNATHYNIKPLQYNSPVIWNGLIIIISAVHISLKLTL